MLRLLSLLFIKIAGWKIDKSVSSVPDQCVMIASPHTSNWDFVYARAVFAILRIPVNYTIKDEYMKFPLKYIFGPLGAIGIDRSPKKPGEKRLSMVDAMINAFKKHKRIVILVTPEATRSLRTEWKSGFYYIAKGAGVPIGLGYLDFEKKEAGVGKMIYLTDSMEDDMAKIMDFYRPIKGKSPELFSTDLRYDRKLNPNLTPDK